MESEVTEGAVQRGMTTSKSEEQTPLMKGAKKSGLATVDFKNLKGNRRDVHLIALLTLITLGDAVEIYLPGVITQAASTELKVSKTQEGLLGIILYLCLALSYFVLPAIKDKLGRKVTLLSSLYISIVATVICSLVPNFWTLLTSRALLGLCIGLNMAMVGVYFVENISTDDMYNAGKLSGMFGFTLGGGWVAILGYLLLGRIGWRYFIVCTSVPIFLVPIFILHFVLTDTPGSEGRVGLQSALEQEVIKVKGFWGRLIKGSVANFINTLQGWGSILLIPALLNVFENKESKLTMDQELLILALLYGVAKLIGRILGIFLLKYVSFRILQPLLSVIIASCYLTLIFLDHSLVVTVVAMGICNMCFCITRCELTLMEFDKHYFGTERIILGAGVMSGCAMMGAAVGAIVASFLSSHQAVMVTFVLSCIQVVTFCFITER